MRKVRVRRRKPGRADARLRAEQTAKPRDSALRMWLVKLPAILLVLGSLYILHELFRAERFTVKAIAVEGTSVLPREQITAALGVEGASIFWVNPGHLGEYLYSRFPIVADVHVQCSLPDQVTVQVQERTNLMLWESGGATWWVDDDGVVLGKAESPLAVMVVHDVDGVAPDPRGRISAVPWQLVRELAEALPSLRSLDYTRDRGLMVYVTMAEWPVYLGYDGNGAEKAAILMALTQQLGDGARVQYIDLRNERGPVYQRQ